MNQSSTPNTDTVIIGGGLAGLCTAFYLLESGRKVLLIEQGQVGKAASWAGGGILSPLKPWTYSPWHDQLTALSKECFEGLKAKLCSVGAEFEENKTGMLYLNEDLESVENWRQYHKGPVVCMQGTELKHFLMRNQVSSHWTSWAETGVWMPSVSNIRNPRFIAALRRYLELHPDFSLMEGTSAELVLNDHNCRHGVTEIMGLNLKCANDPEHFESFIPAYEVIVTAGAWSQDLLAPLNLPGVKPVRGQMLLFEAQNTLPFIIMKDKHYLIPRSDGLVLAGSTTEDAGFDTEVTDDAYIQLHNFASSLMPEFSDIKPMRHWAGLRPSIEGQEGIPLIGPIADIKGLWVNTGHFRNGIVHAPGSAKLLVDLMNGLQPLIQLTLSADQREVIRPDLASLNDIEAI